MQPKKKESHPMYEALGKKQQLFIGVAPESVRNIVQE
jgi:hypothetical protein